MTTVNVNDLMGDVAFKVVSRYERELAEYEKNQAPDREIIYEGDHVVVERFTLGWFVGNKRGIDKLRQGA